jgi:hypothetical protein
MMLLVAASVASGQRPYPLATWNQIPMSKGRFQDREYCVWPVMDRIVADGKPAIPVLISQVTDARWVAEPVYDFWPKVRAGELAHFILQDLFLDNTWTKSTMPDLFADTRCDGAAFQCWAEFRKTHSLADIQQRWAGFWKANQDRIYWDAKCRCFRLN